LDIGAASKKMVYGSTYAIKAAVTPPNADGATTFESSDTKVATVDSAGKVKAKKVGTATVTVKRGSLAKALKVTVVKKALAKAKGLKFKKSKLSWKYAQCANNSGSRSLTCLSQAMALLLWPRNLLNLHIAHFTSRRSTHSNEYVIVERLKAEK
jgi:hypothetical protein